MHKIFKVANDMSKEKINRIVSTLEDIDKTNQMINYYKHQEQSDAETIKSFEETKKDFVKQLAGLLSEYDVEVKIPENQ